MTEKRILVPIDFSHINYPMVGIADAWAKRTGAALFFLHVMPDLTDRFIDPSVQNVFHTNDDKIIARVREHMEQFLTEAGVTVPHENLVREGKAYARILEVQQENDIDLIIMAAHDHSGAGRMFLGSNTDYVLHHVHCPVYVYRG